MLPLHLGGLGACKVIGALAAGVEQLDDLVPVPLRAPAVTLQLRARAHREPRHRRGRERGRARLG